MSVEFALHPQLAKDSVWLADWPLSQLRLINDCQYPWFLLVPRRNNIKEIIDLNEQDQLQLWQESTKLSRLIRQQYQPDKLNIAALGNMVPQLHLHHIARFSTDPAWPAPIWGKLPLRGYAGTELDQLQQQWSLII